MNDIDDIFEDENDPRGDFEVDDDGYFIWNKNGAFIYQKKLNLTVRSSTTDRAVTLNDRLLKSQDIDNDTTIKLLDGHSRRIEVLDKMDACHEDDVASLKFYATIITNIDFELQELWGFKRNIDMHRWWEIPHCQCPAMDNQDAYGTKYNYYNEMCPIHGEKSPKVKHTFQYVIKYKKP